MSNERGVIAIATGKNTTLRLPTTTSRCKSTLRTPYPIVAAGRPIG